MLTIYAARLFGALNLFRGLLLQELVALAVYLATVFPLREALGVPGVALAFGIGQVTGGLAATLLIARRLDVGLAAVLKGVHACRRPRDPGRGSTRRGEGRASRGARAA